MYGVRELNIAIELWGMAFCVIGIACISLFTLYDQRFRNLLVAMFSFELAAAASDALAGVFRGQLGDVAWLGTHVGNLATFVSGFMLIATFTNYLCVRLEEVGVPNLSGWSRLAGVAALVMSALTAFGVFYYIDDGNFYHRSDLYWISLVYAIVVSAVNAGLVLHARRMLSTSAFACLLFYTLIPIVASIIQIAVYGLNFSIVMGVLGLVVLFLELQTEQSRAIVESTEELVQAQEEAADSRIAVMVSQMQPHFLFNALDSIYLLIAEDPEKAQVAVDEFAAYLRTNLDSLNRTEPVPIETELSHVRTYLALEKMSMEDLLRFEVDAQAGGFKVPALSVQTLAENAVKHGVGKMPEGGTVTVRTREQKDSFLVSVVDDGAGFDVEAEIPEGHVGIDNTRKRLEAMCGGTLDITSEPGYGTTVVMTIPKQAE